MCGQADSAATPSLFPAIPTPPWTGCQRGRTSASRPTWFPEAGGAAGTLTSCRVFALRTRQGCPGEGASLPTTHWVPSPKCWAGERHHPASFQLRPRLTAIPPNDTASWAPHSRMQEDGRRTQVGPGVVLLTRETRTFGCSPTGGLTPSSYHQRACTEHLALTRAWKLEVKGARPPLLQPSLLPCARPTHHAVETNPPLGGGCRNSTRNHQIFGFSSTGPSQRYATGTLDSPGLLIEGIGKNKTDPQPLSP